jgi:hypothetical protein
LKKWENGMFRYERKLRKEKKKDFRGKIQKNKKKTTMYRSFFEKLGKWDV